MMRSTSVIARAVRRSAISAACGGAVSRGAHAAAAVAPAAAFSHAAAAASAAMSARFFSSTTRFLMSDAGASGESAAADADLHPLDEDGRPMSITRLVADVLRSGPKTRAQIFYAINRGPLMSSPIAPRQKPNPNRYTRKQNLINQHPPPIPHTFQLIQRKAAEAVKATQAKQVIEPYDELTYPSGPIRSPSHLTDVLQTMLRGKRLQAKPFKSVAQWYGAAEAASTQAILDRLEPDYLAKRKEQLLKSGKSEAEVEQMLLHGPRVSPRVAGPQAPKATGRVAQQYVYVLRDWADARYEARAPALIEKGRSKRERRERMWEEKAEAERPENVAARKAAEAEAAKQQLEKEKIERVRMWRAHALNMNDEQQTRFIAERQREAEQSSQ